MTFLLGGGDLEVGVVHLVVLDRLLRMTTKKVVNFLEETSAPPEKKYWLRLWPRPSADTTYRPAGNKSDVWSESR